MGNIKMKNNKDDQSNKFKEIYKEDHFAEPKQEQQQDGVVLSEDPENAMIENYVGNPAHGQQQNQNLNDTIEMELVESEYGELSEEQQYDVIVSTSTVDTENRNNYSVSTEKNEKNHFQELVSKTSTNKSSREL